MNKLKKNPTIAVFENCYVCFYFVKLINNKLFLCVVSKYMLCDNFIQCPFIKNLHFVIGRYIDKILLKPYPVKKFHFFTG